MNILCLGGGPAGLYFALLMKKHNPAHQITVLERNGPQDVAGWGVVLSQQTVQDLLRADGASAEAILQACQHWNEIDIHFKGRLVRAGGHAFCGIARKRLLQILQQRCLQLGVDYIANANVLDDQILAVQYDADLVIACDGANSQIRARYAKHFQVEMEQRPCRFIWLGTRKLFSVFTFAFAETEYGWVQAHAYQHAADTATVIIEIPENVWKLAGFDHMSYRESLAFCEKIFAQYLGGQALLSGPAWMQFTRIMCKQWVHQHVINGKTVPVVLMGDAAHTVHFTVGAGTRLALEDAMTLAQNLHEYNPNNLQQALTDYQQTRQLAVLKMQSAARNSMEWFENVARYTSLEAEQFAYSLLTRSQRVSHENLRVRDPAYVQGIEEWLTKRAWAQTEQIDEKMDAMPPMFTPFKVRNVLLKNRIVVSPMAQYSAQDGVVSDYHLVHLGSRAMGGAGLILTEMTAVSEQGRITPACPGLYAPEHAPAWARIVDFVHANTDAKIGVQIGHAGPKGSTRRAWEGMDLPLEPEADNWPLLAASFQQYIPGISQIASAMTLEDMARTKQDFIDATEQAVQAGFDWLELHCAHGYLLSSFISPLTNQRTDSYGGTLENRCRYPLEIFAAIRAVWPEELPISIRISAHDWVPGGTTPDDAVKIARLFKQVGADVIVCSAGQVSQEQQPVYGRMFQTPFSDRIRHEAKIATMAVGAISEADHANSIIAAGRADLCAIGRPHLANPAWTLHEAAKIGYRDVKWPAQYLTGKEQLERYFEKSQL